jgi:hypothetical protein
MMENSWPFPTLRKYLAYGLERGLARNFMFFVRIKTHIPRHKIERERAAEMIVA